LTRALATFAVGPQHSLMLEVALPRFREYAARHGLSVVADRIPDLRPASYAKIPLLLDLLREHESVLWLDADVLVTDLSLDLESTVPPGEMHALCTHRTGEGLVPNCGVWLVRRHARPLLERVLAAHERFRSHKWWEQAAVIELLAEFPAWPLAAEWNWHPHDEDRPGRARFRHFASLGSRPESMREALRGV
jgi:hypothetical protein